MNPQTRLITWVAKLDFTAQWNQLVCYARSRKELRG